MGLLLNLLFILRSELNFIISGLTFVVSVFTFVAAHSEASDHTQAGLFSRTLFEFVPDRNALWGFCPGSSTVLLIPCSVPLGHHGAIGAQWGHCF